MTPALGVLRRRKSAHHVRQRHSFDSVRHHHPYVLLSKFGNRCGGTIESEPVLWRWVGKCQLALLENVNSLWQTTQLHFLYRADFGVRGRFVILCYFILFSLCVCVHARFWCKFLVCLFAVRLVSSWLIFFFALTILLSLLYCYFCFAWTGCALWILCILPVFLL